MSVAAGAIASIGAFAAAFAQEPSAVQQALASPHDSLLVRAVRERPADARAQLDRHIAQAGKASRPVADSILRLARRIARSYAAAWNDPFPVENLARFERMSAGERAIKVEADSLRLAGNRALGSDGVAAAMTLWREAFRRSLAVLDSASAAGALAAGLRSPTHFE
jgi:hypothetical protein